MMVGAGVVGLVASIELSGCSEGVAVEFTGWGS
jgi:hypothetical protein